MEMGKEIAIGSGVVWNETLKSGTQLVGGGAARREPRKAPL
jgi:hypothetical protein